eukprot:UN28998
MGCGYILFMSGCLTTKTLCKLYDSKELVSLSTSITWILKRILRLGTFLIPFIPFIFLIPDPNYFNADGSMRWIQWKTFFFGRTEASLMHDFIGTNNLWSIDVDFRASIFLAILFFMIYKFNLKNYRIPILILLLIGFTLLRLKVVLENICWVNPVMWH